MKYYGTAVTDVGIRKKTNQDSVCLKIAQTNTIGQVAMCVICDGMGGLEKGELASATVIRLFSDWFESKLPYGLQKYSWKALSDQWVSMIQEVNQRIMNYGNGQDTSLGTTLSAILLMEKKYMIAHVGDSRVYCIDRSLKQLTEDQTFVEREIKRGHMTREEAGVDARRNMLLQCVGASKQVEPDILFGDVKRNSVFMLCSDGFRHVLTNEEIYENLRPAALDSMETMNRNCRQLVDIIKTRGEKDNISVMVLKCE